MLMAAGPRLSDDDDDDVDGSGRRGKPLTLDAFGIFLSTLCSVHVWTNVNVHS